MTQPSIHIPVGMTIGYGSNVVARAAEALDLAGGNHFLLARNGRGKTTLLRTLARGLPPLSGQAGVTGRVQFIGDELAFDSWLPAKAIFKALLVRETLAAALELADRAELSITKPFGQLSKGNKQKVLLILAEFRARPEEPSVVLLDEPFTGLDTHARDCFSAVWTSRTEGILRFITIHPDYDSMDLLRPVVITDGEIRLARPDEGHVWGTLKKHLK
jgi:ABC-type multidrug transport system ATPase subunit